jgi:hypothetical protein
MLNDRPAWDAFDRSDNHRESTELTKAGNNCRSARSLERNDDRRVA